MLILSNGLTDVVDEGFLKVATSLVKRIKNAEPKVNIISYDRKSPMSDHHLNLNKLLFNKSLITLLKKYNDSVLYIPFPAKTLATALRIFILSLYCKHKLDVMLVLKEHMNFFAKALMKLSRANVIVLSKDAENFYKDFLPENRIKYIKTGVDAEKFKPVEPQKVAELKIKYGFDPDIPVVLHVGHLKHGRNVGELTKIDSKYQVLLVTSTLTKDEQDKALREQLLSKSNIKIIEKYIPAVEEIYQLSDVYFFPTKAVGNCIDVPLSCMEAAACNKPVITTDFGEMHEFVGKQGFYFIDEIESESLNRLIEQALSVPQNNTRSAVMDYDWNNAIDELISK